MERVFISKKPALTTAIGTRLAAFLVPGAVIALSGDLGAGKTTLTGGIAQGLGVKEHVISPTFNILKEYRSGIMPLFHIDAYRLEDGNADIGLEEFIDDGGVSVIEWPEYVASFIPGGALRISIYDDGPETRRLVMTTDNDAYHPYFDALEAFLK
ncbi:MAG: tRNA (adenosine(37)-N6)-threonylcarbamoyltransferase complex ATPase subunit type 1 TsaE [Bacilli bacterium]|jgi:tRNA threonylcarbamoyladenosine biosynthesis protein TsaE